ncbi:hypothetical protein KUCAC02_017699, partial [Chaenocephalus aceratus]
AEGRKSVSTQEELLTLRDQMPSHFPSPPPKNPYTCSHFPHHSGPVHLLTCSSFPNQPLITRPVSLRLLRPEPQTKREQHSPLGQKGETPPSSPMPPSPVSKAEMKGNMQCVAFDCANTSLESE